jgi:hypothetical protein
MAKVQLAQCMIDRTLMATGLDDAIFTMHFQHSGGWDSAKRLGSLLDIKTFWNNVSNVADSAHVLREVRWYDVADAAPHKPTFVETTPLVPGVPGSGAGVIMAPQTALTVTLKTASRKHWGRFYLPYTAGAGMDATLKGSIKASLCDSVAAGALTLAQVSEGAARGQLIVWSPTLGTSQPVTFVQVDNVVDIQRRRRVKKASYKKTSAV